MTEVSKLNRFLGLLIDGIIAYIPMFVFSLISVLTGIGIIYYIGLILGIGYYLLRDALPGGQSIGKKLIKYAAVKQDGSSLEGDYATSATRNVTLFIPLVDLILVLIDKPRLGDDLAKTRVVNK
ncbi:RDD family protein [Flavobacterium microcysteis]|uniref:RDD family protein n=1 Tax=Flavobacterium microcysteis TaxID=2596891 RepID=A0A501Q2R8_9FLAO|nr:RDD family protein [Flavobacterium microcysteis]TPD66983.1 RDD family protein [Flavobacterium microcysteis]